MGGDPCYLLDSIHRHGGEDALRRVAEKGLLIAWSAGALALGPSLELFQRLEPGGDAQALGLTDLEILPHYSRFHTRYEGLEAQCAAYEKERGRKVCRLDDGEGLLLDGQGRLVEEILSPLRVTVAGVEFRNPVIAASGTFGFGREYGELYPLSELGGISCKGTTLHARPGNPPPRVTETPGGMLNAVGLQNPGVEHFIREDLPWLSRQGTRIIANVAGSAVEDYCRTAELLNDTSVDMVELNISCPNVKEGGVQFGVTAEGVAGVTGAVRRVCKKPLMVKLSPNVTDIGEMAAAAESAGADAVSLINTLTGMRVDIRTRRPIIHNNTGGLSGPAVLPVALRMVWQASQRVKIPIVGLGGIATWQDAVEMLLCGASAIQVGTAIFTDPYAPLKIRDGLLAYLEENGIRSVSELTGGVRPW
ncbi:dihydroorotate dehydrogenase [Acutalibacter sp. 1XD8-33]|nr:dihydroorotate dehydrogenase [Acutalibacter sp. 1XD8-33]